MSGRHLRFPFTIGDDGRPQSPASLAEHVKGEVIQLLLTSPGERPFQPRFGGGLERLVFEANSEVTAGIARARLTKALSFYLGERVTVRELVTEAVETTLAVDLVYELAGSSEVQRLRFEHDISGSGDL
jgi:phage baseplate assembly protein W